MNSTTPPPPFRKANCPIKLKSCCSGLQTDRRLPSAYKPILLIDLLAIGYHYLHPGVKLSPHRLIGEAALASKFAQVMLSVLIAFSRPY